MPDSITFVIPGIPEESTTRGAGATTLPAPPIGRVKQSVLVTSARGGGEGQQRVDARPGEDVVVLHIAGGPELWLHPESARDLLMSQYDPGSIARGAEPQIVDGGVQVPTRLQWRLEQAAPSRGATRGFLGDVLMRAVRVVTDIGEEKLADLSAEAIARRFDGQVDPGVYQLDPTQLAPLKGGSHSPIAASSDASLVLIHGTFSQTAGTFGKLWTNHPSLVRTLFSNYDGRVYALDHPTLAESPIANALMLAEAAPDRGRLHLLTHSRGGLVAEVLASACADSARSTDPLKTDKNAVIEMKALAAIVKKKKLQIDRVVRVACPARGTLLASKRLDAYLSVIRWALQLAEIPVAPELVSFLGEVARRRLDPDLLPGLAAQVPDSPLVTWLHASTAAIPGDLRVVAGDIQGDSVLSWVKTLLSDSFYWTDNDLVVQTRSMYGGSARASASKFILDRGGKVTHFNYFGNPQTAAAAVDALKNVSPEGFNTIGPLSWSGESGTGTRAAIITRSRTEAAKLPAVFVIPGILGSNLKAGDDRVWLAWRIANGFDRLAYGGKEKIAADGPIGAFYDELAGFLSQDHDVQPFGFDWRVPISDEAERLADAIDEALDARKAIAGKQATPVRIIAHSMGGLVARMMQIARPKTWQRMMAIDGSRLVMLGTPNNGSWAPMQVLSGDDTMGNLLTTVGAPFRAEATRQLIAAFPGLLQLQAGLSAELGQEQTWKKLAADDLEAMRRQSLWHGVLLQIAQAQWGVPKQAILNEAAKFWQRLNAQRDNFGALAAKVAMVVGNAAFTPAGYTFDSKVGVVYLEAPIHGDGRVTLESALLPGVPTWMLDADHGSLPRRKDAFEAYRDLLAKGETSRLPRFEPTQVARGGPAATAAPPRALVRSRPSRTPQGNRPPEGEHDILDGSATTSMVPAAVDTAAALDIELVNGDLTYISEPLLIGHYRSAELTGAEFAMDRAIGGAMSAALRRGLYPVATGTHQIFLNVTRPAGNPWGMPRPEAVIVAGLGAEGELRGSDLVNTVRAAVIGWAQRLTEHRPVPPVFSLSTTILGSGGSGITVGQAAQLIAQGVLEANRQLADDPPSGPRWPRVDRLTMIELYLDRATEAWHALQALAESQSGYRIAPAIGERMGALPRPPELGYRGASYDFVSARIGNHSAQGVEMIYTLNTKRARNDVRPQPLQLPLIRSLVLSAAKNGAADDGTGKTLFNLLVPVDLEPFITSSSEILLELDPGTSGIPWEILEAPSQGGDDRPWAIRAKLLRKLRALAPSTNVTEATADDRILVIGDPGCDRGKYPMLPGARREAEDVAACLRTAGAEREAPSSATPVVKTVISGTTTGAAEPDARMVLNAVMDRSQPWRIIHIAAHGEPPDMDVTPINPRGVVLSEGFLGPNEISALRVKPELVFVNCCHLARDDDRALLAEINYGRAQFAAGVAQTLIDGGVRCVIAAGWAVDDTAASVFATTLYKHLLDGDRFIDAVAAARAQARACGGNTWAAYQCYGDPDWKFRPNVPDAQRPVRASLQQEFAGIASPSGLILALQRLAVDSELQHGNEEGRAARLRTLEGSFGQKWGRRGSVAEAFGHAWMKMERFDDAATWYERARTADDGTASLASVEQLVNARARRAWQRVEVLATVDAATLNAARTEITDATALLNGLMTLGATQERESLLGSAYKRLALVEMQAGDMQKRHAAVAQMLAHYTEAEKLALDAQRASGTFRAVFYPAMNRVVAQLISSNGTARSDDAAAVLRGLRESMQRTTPDFWSVVGQTELDVYQRIQDGRLAPDVDRLIEEFRRHYGDVSAPRMWASVRDNARLVLGAYGESAPAAEAAAARELLNALISLGQGSRVTESEPAEPSKPKKRARPARRRVVKRKTAARRR